jgi:hypothetical protein
MNKLDKLNNMADETTSIELMKDVIQAREESDRSARTRSATAQGIQNVSRNCKKDLPRLTIV